MALAWMKQNRACACFRLTPVLARSRAATLTTLPWLVRRCARQFCGLMRLWERARQLTGWARGDEAARKTQR